MGAISAYDMTVNHPNPNEQEILRRLHGMATLGGAIIAQTGTGSSEQTYRDRLLAALQSVLSAQVGGNYRYEIRYEYYDGQRRSLVIISASSSGGGNAKKIRCGLSNQRVGGTNEGEVELTVRMDKRAGNGSNKKFDMDVVFPDGTDNRQYSYLGTAATDIQSAGGSGQAYLAAFKFLSRCA